MELPLRERSLLVGKSYQRDGAISRFTRLDYFHQVEFSIYFKGSLFYFHLFWMFVGLYLFGWKYLKCVNFHAYNGGRLCNALLLSKR